MSVYKLSKRQENKYSMFMELETVLDSSKSIVERIPQLNDSTSKFKNIILEIGQKAVSKNTVKKGTVITKTVKRLELESAILEYSSALFAYGSKSENEVTKAIAHVTSSSLDKLRDSEIINKANSILNQLTENASALESFDVKQADIEKLGNCIRNYKNSGIDTSVSKTESLLLTKTLQELFNSGMHILEFEIDKIVDSLKSKEKKFYDSYYSVRYIKNLGIRHKKQAENITPVNTPVS